jgi:4-amino-4-deoxy-L-arabinose transferase-like glycosyltransferase
VSDESAAAVFSIDILKGTVTNPFISGWFEFPSLWFFLIAPFIGTFGKTFFAIRLFPMILGSACIPALIWAVRPVLPRQGALVAGLALAMLGIHIHFSRYGLNNMADSFSGIVLLGILLRYRHRPTFALATAVGLTMGAAVYGYASARVFPLIVVLYIGALVVRARHTWRIHMRNLVVIALTAMVVSGPLLVHYFEQPDQFWSVVQRSSIIVREADGTTNIERWAADHEQTVAEVVVRNIAYTMQALFWGPVEGWFGTPRAVLTIPLSAVALIGVIGMVVRRRDRAVFAVAAWLAVFCVMSAVNWPIAAGQRLVSLLGILALLVGYGANILADMLRKYVNQRAIALVVFALVSIGGVMSLDHYFNTFVKREAGRGDPHLYRAGIVALVAQQLPAHTWIDVYRSDVFNYESTPVLQFALMRIDANIIEEPAPDQLFAPIIIYPIEAASRVIRMDNYVEYRVRTPEGNPTLIFAVRDDAPWAAEIIQNVIEKNE